MKFFKISGHLKSLVQQPIWFWLKIIFIKRNSVQIEAQIIYMNLKRKITVLEMVNLYLF